MAIGAALIGGLASASAAKKAAKAQTQAANNQLAVQKEMYDTTRGDLAPYRGAGTNALDAVLFEMGLGPRPVIGGTAPTVEAIAGTQIGGATPVVRRGMGSGTRADDRNTNALRAAAGGGTMSPTTYRVGGQTFNTLEEAQAYARANPTGGTEYAGFQASPGYAFAVEQGQDAIERAAANSGGLFSGNTGKALTDYRIGMANQDYGNYFNRLMGLTSIGQNAANMSGQAAQNYASGASNAFANIGNAQAAGAIGAGNAFNSGLSNALGIWQYQNQTGGMGSPFSINVGNLFGGNSWG